MKSDMSASHSDKEKQNKGALYKCLLPVKQLRASAGREAIAREKANAERLSREINAEIEALILGTKRVG